VQRVLFAMEQVLYRPGRDSLGCRSQVLDAGARARSHLFTSRLWREGVSAVEALSPRSRAGAFRSHQGCLGGWTRSLGLLDAAQEFGRCRTECSCESQQHLC
jgi:hypothetical protein